VRTHISRRGFLSSSAAGAAGLVILKDSRSATAAAANEKLNIAGIGVGGQGGGDLNAVAGGNNVVALCDVDSARGEGSFKKFTDAKPYEDFRKMLDEMHAQIDAVVVGTPDHTHAVAAIAAMKLGKHVFCEKPLTRTVYESHLMRLTAAKHKVATQMGNQGSASEGLRRAVELAWGGFCGDMTECHLWLANGDGPQERPKDTPPVPATLNWDLWLGPAPVRPYHPCYVPFKWRQWRDFGSGGGGDMGCHSINMAVRALRLDLLWNPDSAEKPEKPPIIRIEGQASELNPETYPRNIKAVFDFPARGNRPALKVHWYNGGLKPPKEVLRGYAMTQWGCLVGGEKAALLSTCPWNTNVFLLPEAQFKDYQGNEPRIPRSPGHYAEWVRACKGGEPAFSNFDIGAPTNEIVHLVHVATLAGKPIEYDPWNCKIVNDPSLNPLLHREYRAGWSL